MKLSTLQPTWELLTSCEDQLKAECRLFHFKISGAGKTPKPRIKPSMKFFSCLGWNPACGGLETLSERGSVTIVCLVSKFHPPLIPQMKKYLHWEKKWTNMETESGPGSAREPWAAVGRGEPCSLLRGEFWRIPTLHGCTALYSLETDFPRGISIVLKSLWQGLCHVHFADDETEACRSKISK